jgi:hypothetical protein
MPDPHLPSIEQALTLITVHQAKIMHLPPLQLTTKGNAIAKPLQTIFQLVDYENTYRGTSQPDWLIVKILSCMTQSCTFSLSYRQIHVHTTGCDWSILGKV